MSSSYQLFRSLRSSTAQAFSLVELLVVVTIIGVLIAMSASMFSGIWEANSLSRASQIVVDQISQGRQIASARNVPIEVRFVLQPKLLPSPGASLPGVYNAIQLWRVDPAGGESRPVSKLVSLPNGFVVAAGTTSPYLSPPLVSTATPPPLSGTQDYAGMSLAYVGIEIRPTGLMPALVDQGLGNTFLTVVALRHSDVSSNDLTGEDRKVDNYAIVQLNPYTGLSKVYQP